MPYLIKSMFKVIVNLSTTFRNQNADAVLSKRDQEDMSDCACSPSTIYLINTKVYPSDISDSDQESSQIIIDRKQHGEKMGGEA